MVIVPAPVQSQAQPGISPMGSSNSTNSNSKPAAEEISNKGYTSVNSPTPHVTEGPSLSLLSGGGSIDSVEEPESRTRRYELYSQRGEGGGATEGVLTLWKPTVSEELIKEEAEEGDQEEVYVFGSASFNLDSKKKNLRRCSCTCCSCKKNRGPARGGRSEMKGGPNGSENFDEYATAEVISLQSGDDIVVIPSEVFPLDMVATLDLSPSEVKEMKAKPKKVRRNKIPDKPDKPMSLWGLIKSAVGKDLTKFPLPVNFAEPLSMLQRLTEDYEYSSILDHASSISDSLEQLAYVAAFTVSSYASTAVRTSKPFNPMLGETYEFDRTEDLGWRCIAEQVCHHPPIAALHCESTKWVQWQQFTMKSSFKGTYLEIHPLGIAHLRFKTSENHYTWKKVSTIVRNLYIGKIYIEQEGEMDITNHATNEWCHLKFNCGGMFSSNKNIMGKVYNKANEAKWEIKGTWDKELTATKLDNSGKPISGETKTLWQNKPLPPDADKRYGFSQFACELNEVEEGVAPTDARNRPDQRLMENAKWDEANIEKQRLEDKQREAGKQRIKDGEKKLNTSSNLNATSIKSNGMDIPLSGPEDGFERFYTPCWFVRQRDPISGQCIYMYNGEYWNCKSTQDWKRCPSLYS